MKILFVAYLESDANVRCVQQLQSALSRRGVQSDLLTFRWDRAKPPAEPAGCGMRYRADTWYRFAQLRRDADGRVAMPWTGYLRVALARGLATLAGGPAYGEQGFPFLAGLTLGRTLRTLCEQNRYDWVISVSYPFMLHRIANRFRPPRTRFAMYALDPFYRNATYPKRRERARLRLERRVSEAAERIFHVPEQAEDYRCEELRALGAKYRPLNYPNLIRQEPTDAPCPLRTEPGGINLVYLGTLYADIRTPDALLMLFEAMRAVNPALRLHLIGNVFGVGAGETVARYKARLGDALQTYRPVPPGEVGAVLQAADVLVNLGNAMRNQVPSKLWEYIATGKPILAICMRPDCNTIPYLSRYPDALWVLREDAGQPQAAARAAEFCARRAGSAVPWATLCELYPLHQTDAVAQTMIDALGG